MAEIPVTPINRLPWGLLSFLGIKNGGRAPSQLGDLLVPVWNSADLYTQTNSECVDVVANITATGFNTFVEVSAGEHWLVHEFAGFTAPLGAGQSLKYACCALGGVGSSHLILAETTVGAVVGERSGSSCQPGRWFPPRTQFGFLCYQLAAGPVGLQTAIRITRFPI